MDEGTQQRGWRWPFLGSNVETKEQVPYSNDNSTDQTIESDKSLQAVREREQARLHELASNYTEPEEPPVTLHLPLSTLLVSSAFGIGFLSGLLGGARQTALVYLAENAHRLPRTVQGWYFYNKTKYYRMILGGVQQGSRTGLQLAGWTGGFCLLDVMAEHARMRYLQRTPNETLTTSTSIANVLGHWSDGSMAGFSGALVALVACELTFIDLVRLPRPMWGRMALLGTTTGGLVGALRDFRQHILERMDPKRPHII
ncbi:hypothetical protein MYAM1_000424 [Malassezia yamatoensis]|uniref:Uncharacterized protein n=1 Tax=Malassezia yamatoensis TaxID=253288 RepID=A0AAJ6CFZ4_9BASI|nr:hypothetical protein MYAM1_000424 [Malassezia yamatoensis]